MDSILELFNTILSVAFFGGVLLMAFKIAKFKKFNGVKSEIQNLQARLSQFRLALKGKMKKKANTFRASFKSAVSEGDMIDKALRQLCENKFETGEDLQAYFDLSRRIVNFIHVENGTDATTPASLENNFMCSDFKTEMDIVRIIKEMCELSSRINERIDEHNRINPGHILARVDSMQFSSQTEITRIFREDPSLQSEKAKAS